MNAANAEQTKPGGQNISARQDAMNIITPFLNAKLLIHACNHSNVEWMNYL
jgi:hypothetical protein